MARQMPFSKTEHRVRAHPDKQHLMLNECSARFLQAMGANFVAVEVGRDNRIRLRPFSAVAVSRFTKGQHTGSRLVTKDATNFVGAGVYQMVWERGAFVLTGRVEEKKKPNA